MNEPDTDGALDELVAAGDGDEEDGFVDWANAGAANTTANAAAVKVRFIMVLSPYVMGKAARGNNPQRCAT
jgi:hypothetical protein